MKKYTKLMALVLALTMLMGMSVFAEEFEVTGVSATIDPELPKFDLTAEAESGEMYLLLILNGEDSLPTANNILYVNQVTAADGVVVFEDVYPKDIADSTIYLAGGSTGMTKIGAVETVKPAYKLGDLNSDTKVDNKDLVLLKRYASNPGKYPLSDNALLAANLNGDTAVNNKDIVMLKRFLSNPSKYPIEK